MRLHSFLLATILIASIGNAAFAQSCAGVRSPRRLPWPKNWLSRGPHAIPKNESSRFRGAAEFN
jgi:hypothetical protein